MSASLYLFLRRHLSWLAQQRGALLVGAVCTLFCLLGYLAFATAHAQEHGQDQRPQGYSQTNQQATALEEILALPNYWPLPGLDETMDVAWGDMDGDGDLDLAVANRDSGIKLYRNESMDAQGRLTATDEQGQLKLHLLAVANLPTSAATVVAWGDMTNDGRLDLAVGTTAGSAVYCQSATAPSTPTFDRCWSEPAGSTLSNPVEITSLAWGDVDGDGLFDLVSGGRHGSLRLYQNRGTAPWLIEFDRTFFSPTLASGPQHVQWGDLNGDGYLDLVAGGCSIVAYINRGAPSSPVLTETSISSALPFCVTDLALADADQPTGIDIAIATEIGIQLAYQTDYTGSVTYGGFQSVLNSGGSVTSLAWGDWDADGDLDLAAGYSGALTAAAYNRIFENIDGALTWDTSSGWQSSDSLNTQRVAWGDVDGDGDLDLLAGNAIGAFPDRNFAVNLVYENQMGTLQITADTPLTFGDPNAITRQLLWADTNGDDWLDLVEVNLAVDDAGYITGGPPSYYHNRLGLLEQPLINPWERTAVVAAWGDANGDGCLDVALGGNSDGKVHVYLTTPTTRGCELPRTRLEWQPQLGASAALAWGDIDGDGDLDLAVGNSELLTETNNTTGSLEIYLSVDGGLQDQPAATFPVPTLGMAWGDMDNDGDLDLATGSSGALYLYENRWSTNTDTPLALVWSNRDNNFANAVAWGDVDGNGYLDLAVGNGGQLLSQINKVFFNTDGRFDSAEVWLPEAADRTGQVTLTDLDNDGDLDLITTNLCDNANTSTPCDSNKVYLNHGGRLSPLPDYTWGQRDYSFTLAWGDVNNDGLPDLAVGNVGTNSLYLGQIPADPLAPGRGASLSIQRYSNGTPTFAGNLTTALAPADQVALSWIRNTATIPISYTLFHPITGTQVARVLGYYSLNGGGEWQQAVNADGSDVEPLATCPYTVAPPPSCQHSYRWDVFRSAFFGQSDNVVFRLVAIPDVKPQPNGVAGPYQRGYLAAQTFPFRVRGTQVRVINRDKGGAEAVPTALVYRLPQGAGRGAQPLAGSERGVPFRTNADGYLRGRAQLLPGEQLVALAPVTATARYTLYQTSAPVTNDGVALFPVQETGIQTLTVSAANQLALFNLAVALEWDAHNDPAYMEQLRFDLRRTAELLYDWSNGQATLGEITVYHDAPRIPADANGAQPWLDADIRIYATNRLRPNADVGGLVITRTVDVDRVDVIFQPGQVRMPAVWDRYGQTGGEADEDWPQALAHELGHYLFFLEDNYLGYDGDTFIALGDGCPGVMTNPYRAATSEFHPALGWTTGTVNESCRRTMSHITYGRSDWETITRYYTTFAAPSTTITETNPGPAGLPLAVTRIREVGGATTALPDPIFYLEDETGHPLQPTAAARAYLFHGEQLIALGRPAVDTILAKGAFPDDRVCLFDEGDAGGRTGCQTVRPGESRLTLKPRAPDWPPVVTITPATTRTLEIALASNVNATYCAQLYVQNQYLPALPATVKLAPRATGYAGVTEPLPKAPNAGLFHLWALSDPDAACDRAQATMTERQLIIDFSLGGAPCCGKAAAPLLSPDGQMAIRGRALAFTYPAYYIVHALTRAPDLPAWATVIGTAYQLARTQDAPPFSNAYVNFQYLSAEVAPDEEPFLMIYTRPKGATAWQPLPTNRNADYNSVSAPACANPTEDCPEAMYALVASLGIPLTGPGWNNFAYPVQGKRAVTEALRSIAGSYSVVWSYDPANPADPWRGFDPTVPPAVATLANELTTLEFGKGYWLHITATDTITLYLKGAAGVQSSNAGLTPPSLFYGAVYPTELFTPTAGMAVEARMDNQRGKLCAQGVTVEQNGQIIFALKVPADDGGDRTGCGAVGRVVQLMVNGLPLGEPRAWDNTRAINLVQLDQHLYLPLISR